MAQDKIKHEEYQQLGGINSKASQYSTGMHEFLDISNLNFKHPGALTKRDGSTFYIGATIIGKITGLYEFARLNGSSYVIAMANTNAYTVTAGWNSFKSGLNNGALWDFSTMVDRLFAANGTDMFRYDGANTSNYSLPNGASFTATAISGGSLASGTYIISYGYMNDRGYQGPGASPVIVTIVGSSGAGSLQYSNLSFPSGYGISAMVFYRTDTNGNNLFQTYTADSSVTSSTDTGASALTASPIPPYFYFTLIPKYLEIYNNQMMMAGFSSLLSTVVFSDIGEPEGITGDFNFEVRTNDGDRITAMQPYNGVFLVFKEKSFHRLSGDNPNNFLLSEISDQYGCLSNRATVVWNNWCWFLDRKGICEFNGANITIKSNRIESVFIRMNVDAAKDNATAVHDRLNNQVKFSFPVDGSTQNNMTAVYDYVADAWTTESGYKPAVQQMIRGKLDRPWVMYGGYTGTIHNFGASYFGDNGQGMTCLLKTRFIADLGNSVEKQFRRVFLDVKEVGSSSAINVNIYQDYGASIVLSRVMYQAPFQSRIDFGIEAKSIALELSNFSNTDPVQINGYTVEYRLQRRV